MTHRVTIILTTLLATGFAITVSRSAQFPMPLPPLITSTFPASKPGPHVHIGYAFVRSPPSIAFSLPQPTFASSSKPVLRVREVAYAVYYPSAPPKGSWWGGEKTTVQWTPDPVQEVVKGYERFFGQRRKWIGEEIY